MTDLSFIHYAGFVLFVALAGYYCIGRFGQWRALQQAYFAVQSSNDAPVHSQTLAAFRLGYISYKSSVRLDVYPQHIKLSMQPGFGLGHPPIKAIPAADIELAPTNTAIGKLVEVRFKQAPGVVALVSENVAQDLRR